MGAKECFLNLHVCRAQILVRNAKNIGKAILATWNSIDVGLILAESEIENEIASFGFAAAVLVLVQALFCVDI